MEKEMLVHLKLKEGKLETFMGWMQSDEAVSYTHLTLPTKA